MTFFAGISKALGDFLVACAKKARPKDVGVLFAAIAITIVLIGAGTFVALSRGFFAVHTAQANPLNWEIDSSVAGVVISRSMTDSGVQHELFAIPPEVTNPVEWAKLTFGEQVPLPEFDPEKATAHQPVVTPDRKELQ